MDKAPVPYFLLEGLPATIAAMNPIATSDEVADADAVRKRYFLPNGAGAYMVDIVRAFRPVAGAKVYVEVGSRDKGNIAWLQRALAPDPLIIDVDLEHIRAATKRLRSELRTDASYVQIQGDSVGDDTVAAVRSALGGRQADAIFLDSSHMYNHIVREFNSYYPMLKTGGLLLIHDAFWEGNDADKGKAQALQLIDRFMPVYAVYMNEPARRYAPLSTKANAWGGVAVIIKD